MGIILYFCKLENILLPQFNTPVKYLLTMDSEQKPSNNPYADFRGLLEPEQVVFHGKNMRKMRSVEEFSDYCMEQDLDVTVQEPLMSRYITDMLTEFILASPEGDGARNSENLTERAVRYISQLPTTEVAGL